MKIKNKLLLAAVALTGLTFNACDDGNAVVDEVFDTTTRGVVLRTINIVSNELPIGQDDSFFGVDLELQDIEDGALVESVEVYVAFRDLTVEEGAPDLDKAEVLVETVPKSEFTIGEYGFPRFVYSITLPEMLSALSLASSDLDGGDQFTVRFEVVMIDGRRFSVADNTDTSTGSFFASPFLYSPTVTCPLDNTTFVGNYLIEQLTPEVDGPTLSDGSIVELVIGSTSTQRVFQTANYPDYCADLRPFTIDLICGEFLIPSQSSGCACGSGGDWFTNAIVPSTYDPSDDSVFEVTFTDDTQSDCSSPAQTTYRFTKQ